MLFIVTTSRSNDQYIDMFMLKASCVKEALEMIFAKLNRGSGEEIEFEGPSMSVGDEVMLQSTFGYGHWRYICAPMGWKKKELVP